jgi:glycosyltransferase involved in cell wall biosynthesis
LIPVLILNRRFGIGGAERQLVTLLRHIDTERFKVTACSFYDGGELASDVRAISGIEWHALGKRGRWDILPLLRRYWQLLGRTRPRVVYGFLAVSNVLALVARLRGANVVWGIRASDMDAAQYDWLERVVFSVERLLARGADLVIANSQAGARHIASRGFPAERIAVVPNGIDVSRFRRDTDARQAIRAELGVRDRDLLVGMVSRLDPMKDHETFLAAAKQLAQMHDDVHFVCVGEGPVDYAQRLAMRTRELGLAERLRWMGYREDMTAVYNALDVLCLSSAYGEGFPNVIGEAMACGVPCVATDVGDARDVIADTGLTVPPRHPDALAAAIAAVLEHLRTEPQMLAERTRNRIVSEYSVERMVRRTEELLAGVARDRLPSK